MLPNVQPRIIIIVMVISSLALFLAFNGYNLYVVDNPLVTRIENMDQVAQVELDKDTKVVKVELIDKSNLPFIYHQLIDETSNSGYKVQLVHNPTDRLLDFYYQAQFIIQEALEQGSYEDMRHKLISEGEKKGIETTLYIDQEYLYFCIVEDNTRDYVAIIPRQIAREVKTYD